MYEFYYPSGARIEGKNIGEQFVQLYSQIYYFLNRDIHLENRIENILKSTDPMTERDMTDVLRWKTGGKAENGVIKTQWNTISVKEVLVIANAWKEECSFDGSLDDENKFEKHFNKLTNHDENEGVDGMGPVYALTILYFISNGKYPIFDRFAYYAITAIHDEVDIKEIVKDKTLSSEYSRVFPIYREYSRKIQSVFSCFGFDETSIFSNRDIDRALWAYGHLFNQTKTNKLYKKGLSEPQNKG